MRHEARDFYAEATGARVLTVEHLDEWLGSLQVKDKTAGMRRAAVERLAVRTTRFNLETDVPVWFVACPGSRKPTIPPFKLYSSGFLRPTTPGSSDGGPPLLSFS
jgi:hypothetical protein